jgi:hypothetical protein
MAFLQLKSLVISGPELQDFAVYVDETTAIPDFIVYQHCVYLCCRQTLAEVGLTGTDDKSFNVDDGNFTAPLKQSENHQLAFVKTVERRPASRRLNSQTRSVASRRISRTHANEDDDEDLTRRSVLFDQDTAADREREISSSTTATKRGSKDSVHRDVFNNTDDVDSRQEPFNDEHMMTRRIGTVLRRPSRTANDYKHWRERPPKMFDKEMQSSRLYCSKYYNKLDDRNDDEQRRNIEMHSGIRTSQMSSSFVEDRKSSAQKRSLEPNLKTPTEEKSCHRGQCTTHFMLSSDPGFLHMKQELEETDKSNERLTCGSLEHIQTFDENNCIESINRNECFTHEDYQKNFHRSRDSREPDLCREYNECYQINGSLNSHRKQCNDEKAYRGPEHCTCCASISCQKMHLRIHEDEKPRECVDCSRRFMEEDSLDIHPRSRTDEKPSVSSECSETFASSHNLKTHLSILNGKQPYECPQCRKSFTRKVT